MSATADAWGVTKSSADPLTESLIKRAMKREVVESPYPNQWVVLGNPKLSDNYDEYLVKETGDGYAGPETSTYQCDCSTHQYGDVRRRKVCSHITAVILHRQGKLPRLSRLSKVVTHPEPELDFTESAEPGVTTRTPISATGSADKVGGGRLPLPGSIPMRKPKRVAPPSTTLPDEGLWDESDFQRTPLPSELNRYDPPLPAKFAEFEHSQWETINAIVEAYRDGFKVVFLDAPTGCLSGDTIIGFNRAGGGRQLPISELVRRFHGERTLGKSWDKSIPTRVQRAADDGTMKLGLVRDAWCSGEKNVYLLTTAGGREIKATTTHPFQRDDGSFVPLGRLVVGDRVRVLLNQGGIKRGVKRWDRLVNGLHHHPHAGRRGVRPEKGGFSVTQHRLVAEARDNGVGYEEWVKAHREGTVLPEWGYLNPQTHDVHHLDGDYRNNDPNNLVVVTKPDHRRLHNHYRNVSFQIGIDVISSIEYAGRQMTYDLELADAPHNFIANGFVVHNSGKTLVAEAVRRVLGVKGIYTCTTKTLQKQVMRDFGDYARQIMGRKNYSTFDDPHSDLTADDCVKRRVSTPACANCPGGSPLLYWNTEKTQQTLGDIGESEIKKMHCAHCHPWSSCPYEVAKFEAGNARLAVLNTAYFLAENIFDPKSPFKTSPLVILDEADRLEEELMGFVEVEIGPRTRKELGVGLPEKKTVDEAWVDWLVDDLTPAITRAKEDLPNQARSEIEFVRRQKSLNRLQMNVKWLCEVPRLEDEESPLEAPQAASEQPKPILRSGWVYCADSETEILAERGWLKYDQLRLDDRILSVAPGTEEITWQPLRSINIFPYEGELTHWTSNRMDALVTDDHRWLTESGFRSTKEIADSGIYVRLAGGTPRGFAAVAAHPDEIVELIGWVITEGWLRPEGAIEISQSVHHNPKYCDRIAELCDWLRARGLHVRDQLQKGGKMRRWYLSVAASKELLSIIPNKRLTPFFLRSLTTDQAHALFNVLMAGDGHVNKGGTRYWSQQDKGRIDGFQMLSAMLGIRTRERVSDHYDGSEVVAYRTQGAFSRPHQFTRKPYRGDVWCPTVDSGTWMARRNGVTYWTGNTGYEHKEDYQATVAFKPIKIDTLGQQFLWNFGQRFLLMSASFISVEDTAADLGLEDGEWTSVSMASTFPVERRPIFPICTTFVNNKTKEEAYPELSHDIDEILKVHDDVRVLIHTVSYDLGNYLFGDLMNSDHRNRIYTYRSPQDRERTLSRYLSDPRGVVLAPSFDRGVDLHQDDCRVIIIPKVPFGNLGDKQIKTRMYSTGRAGKVWYVRQAIRTIVQMTGRGMRSADDECTTYILDKEFLRLYAENRRLFPDWWKEAIVWDSLDPHWRGIKNLEMIAMRHLTS